MLTITPAFTLQWEENIYALRTRGALPELLLNGDGRIYRVDCLSQKVSATLPLPETVQDFGFETWLVNPDGSHSYVFPRENAGYGLDLDFTANTIDTFALPPAFLGATGLCWYTPDLHVRSYDRRNWSLRNRQLILEDDQQLPGFMSAVASRFGAPAQSVGVLEMSTDGAGCYAATGELMGYVALDGSSLLSAPLDPQLGQLSHVDNLLLLCTQHNVDQLDSASRSTLISAAEGENFLGLQVLRCAGVPHIATLSSSVDGPQAVLRVYRVG